MIKTCKFLLLMILLAAIVVPMSQAHALQQCPFVAEDIEFALKIPSRTVPWTPVGVLYAGTPTIGYGLVKPDIARLYLNPTTYVYVQRAYLVCSNYWPPATPTPTLTPEPPTPCPTPIPGFPEDPCIVPLE